MGALRTASLAAVLLAGPAGAGIDLGRELSGCAGRLSAAAEHSALFGGPGAAQAERLRREAASLLDALPQADAVAIRAHRIDAKVAQAALLSQASFASRDADRARAARLSALHLARCAALFAGG